MVKRVLNKIIKKLSVILVLCGGIAILLYFTDLGSLFNGEVKEKVQEFKEEAEEKIEAIKEKKKDIERKIEKVEDKIKDLKKLKLKDLIK